MTVENILFYLFGGMTGFIFSEILQFIYQQKQEKEDGYEKLLGEFK